MVLIYTELQRGIWWKVNRKKKKGGGGKKRFPVITEEIEDQKTAVGVAADEVRPQRMAFV